MDMSGNNKLELEKRIDHSYNNQPHSLCSNWRYVDANTTNPSLGLSSNENPIVVCSSASMMDSFGPSVWELSANSQPSGFNEINVQNAEASWDSSSSMIKNGVFLPNLSHSLSEYPADCAFIERASHFSSFSGANLGHMVSPIGIHHPQNNVMHMVGHYEEVPLPVERGNVEASTSKDERKGEKSYNESEEAVFSGSGGRCQEDGEPCFTKGLGLKKRKKGVQDMKPKKASNGIQLQTGESAKDTTGVQQKEDQNPTSTANTTPEKHDKQASQASDPPKEYIHVRARRGQATNSHSLAERVRREKISERMKLLQELVPGCSKVTGKAVMLDEIINYVQSLQRQVEFLSMKLATVNPRLDLNIKQLLAKEHLFSAQAGSSSSLGFSPAMSMACPSVQPPQSFFVSPGIGNSSDMLRRIVDSGLTTMSSGSIPQLQNAWEDELHNVVQMGLDSGTLAPGHMKSEP